MSDLYDATIPVFGHGLRNIKSWLKKSETYAKEKGISMNELLEAKLAPDMINLIQQIGYSYFMSLEAAENLSGKAQPEMSYAEKSMDELHESIDRAVNHLGSIKAADVDQHGAKEVETFLSPGKKLSVDRYVRYYALPNFYFHVVTTYDILRHKGVPLAKPDYIGDPS